MQELNPLLCTSALEDVTQCSFSNLVYAQWLNGTVLDTQIQNPLPGQVVTSDGYALNYAKYASSWITPEFGFWKKKNGVEYLSEADFPDALAQTYKLMNV